MRVITEAGEFAVKVDLQTHHSVIGGSTVQEHVVERMPRLVPRPVPAVSGELAVTMRSRRIMVSDWATSEPPTDEDTTWARIGEAAAALHSLPTVPRDFAVPLDLACEDLERQPGWPASLVRAVVDRVRHIDGGAISIVHGQLNLANLIQRGDQSIAILDWDEAGTGLTAIDLGYPLICEFLTENLEWHADQAHGFFRGYQDGATIELPPAGDVVALALLHALRSAMFANQLKPWNRVAYVLGHEPELQRAFSG